MSTAAGFKRAVYQGRARKCAANLDLDLDLGLDQGSPWDQVQVQAQV